MTIGILQGPVLLNPFADESGLRLMPDSTIGEFEASPDGNEHESYIDYTVPFDCHLQCVRAIVKNHKWGDYVWMEVVHPQEGILGQFGVKYRFDDSKQDQGWIDSPYKTTLAAGLIIRTRCRTTQMVGPVKFILNMKLHQIVAVP